jgi:hypothetical protein
MDHRADLEAVGSLGRAARISAVICLLIACALLVSSLVSANKVSADINTSLPNPTLRLF